MSTVFLSLSLSLFSFFHFFYIYFIIIIIIILIIIIIIIIIIAYVYMSSMCTDLLEKCLRFPQGLSLVLYLYFRIFCFGIVELWVLVNFKSRKKKLSQSQKGWVRKQDHFIYKIIINTLATELFKHQLYEIN